MQLVTERLVLRDYEPEDWKEVLRYQRDPRHMRYYPWSARNAEDVQGCVNEYVARQAEDPRSIFQVAITLPTEGLRLIGSCGVRVNDFAQREGNIGYELDPEYWRRGYATEAASAVMRLGFEKLGLHRIWAQCNADNRASARVLEKLGMRCEAHFREHDYFKGRWWDSLVFAILEREWTPSHLVER